MRKKKQRRRDERKDGRLRRKIRGGWNASGFKVPRKSDSGTDISGVDRGEREKSSCKQVNTEAKKEKKLGIREKN